MKHRFFVVFCTKNIAKPKLYKREAYAIKKAQEIPSFKLQTFFTEEQAQQFFSKKSKQMEMAKGENIYKRLKENLTYESIEEEDNEYMKEQDIQSKQISQNQKQKRSIWFNRLLQQNLIFKKADFKYTKEVSIIPGHHYEGFFDGSTLNNPGESGVGYVIKPANKIKNIITNSIFIGRRTNNIAEIIALILMMGDAYINGVTHLKVFGDSKIIIGFMAKSMVVRTTSLINSVQTAQEVADRFEDISFEHISRTYNYQADRLARKASSKH